MVNGAAIEEWRSWFILRFSGRRPHEQAERCRQLLDQLDPEAHESLARIHAALAVALVTDASACALHAAAAQRSAESAGSESSLLWATLAQCVSRLDPEGAEVRAAGARRMLEAEPDDSTRPLMPTAFFLLLGALTELGRLAEVDRALDPGGALLCAYPELEQSRYASWFRCVRATLDGRADAAEALTAEGYARAAAADDPDAASTQLGQLAVIRWMRGRTAELELMLMQARQLLPDDLIWSATLAWVWQSQGRTSAAQGIVRGLPQLDTVPRDRNWVAALSILATVVAELGERRLAEQLLELLSPFSSRLAAIGLGITVWGSVARPLALLHLSLGQIEAAATRYREAIRVCTLASAHAWLAESQFEYARLLRRWPDAAAPSDASPAQLLREALATASALGLHDLESQCLELRSTQLETGVLEEAASSAELPSIQVIGDFTVRAVNGTVATWQSRKARELLKILVSRRGEALPREHAFELLWPGEDPRKLGNRLAVAVATLRRAFDPERCADRNEYLSVTRETLRLNIERCSVDIECWFAELERVVAREDEDKDRLRAFAHLLQQVRAEILGDEPDAEWAERLRAQARTRAFTAAYEFAATAMRQGEALSAIEIYRWLIDVDPYDEQAHRGLIAACESIGARGHAAEARAECERRMAELGIDADAKIDR